MRRILLSSMAGNALEWYDFALYGQMAFLIGHLFFPSDNIVAQNLATFAAFAVAFIFRPLGGIFFGWIGDRYGRKKALVTAILMMAIPTGAIGLLPTHESIGILAPILLVIIRIFQGLSLGGEFGGAITYIAEHSEPHKRGLLGSTTMSSLIIGFLFGSFMVMIVKSNLSTEAFESWGWRILFILGVFIGLVGFYIRNLCTESPVYETAKAKKTLSQSPLKDALIHHWPEILKALSFYTATTMPFYLTAIYFISYTKERLNLNAADALQINMITMSFMFVGVFIGALISDRIGRKRYMVSILFLIMAFSIPVMTNMQAGNYQSILFWQVILGFLVGNYIGPNPALLVEVFPTSIRYTGMSLAINGATVIFGGTTPIVCIALLEYFNTPLAISFYLILCCLISLTAFCFYKDDWLRDLNDDGESPGQVIGAN